MILETHDIVGTAGVILIVAAYFLLQVGKMRNDALMFSVSNAVGAALIIISLLVEFNASAFLVEFFWLLISIVGIVRYFARRRSAGGEGNPSA